VHLYDLFLATIAFPELSLWTKFRRFPVVLELAILCGFYENAYEAKKRTEVNGSEQLYNGAHLTKPEP
jgi:hypothetical protein